MSLKLPKLNSITVAGRLTREGETRYLPNGNAVFNFSIAIDDGYWDKQSNQWVSTPVFMDVTVWGKQAEKLNSEVKKGSPVIVEGKLKQRAYTAKDGQNKRITEIVASRVSCLEYSGEMQASQEKETQSYSYSSKDKQPEPDYVNSDVPF